MKTTGKPYKADYTANDGKTVRMTRRAVYHTVGEPTPEQRTAIENVERIVHMSAEKQRINGNPYQHMRNAEYLGVELGEEVRLPDGRWRPLESDDVLLSTMQTGAVL